MQIVRRSLLLGAALAVNVLAQGLRVRVDADQIRVSAPSLHFLVGKPLEQMHNGTAVAFDFQLMVMDDTRAVLRRSFERFVVSYDLWEEKFSVTRMRGVRSSASHLSAAAAEAWCVDSISLLSNGLPENRPLFIRLDLKAQEGRASANPLNEEEGISISSLIDIFSRATKPQDPQRWRLEAGPVRLQDLRKASGRTGT